MPSVKRADIQIGDLVFYYSDIHHVTIYVGDGMVMSAPQPGDVVRMVKMDSAPIHSIGRRGSSPLGAVCSARSIVVWCTHRHHDRTAARRAPPRRAGATADLTDEVLRFVKLLKASAAPHPSPVRTGPRWRSCGRCCTKARCGCAISPSLRASTSPRSAARPRNWWRAGLVRRDPDPADRRAACSS